jgi:F-type H+-transporting ATPase subunit c
MDNSTLTAIASITGATFCMSIGSIGPAFAEGKAVAQAMMALAQQPDQSGTISRTLFVGLAMIESMAIYCLVISIILIFANPFWAYTVKHAVPAG